MTLKKADQLSELDLAILPAIFGRSNMGLGLPDARAVAIEKIPLVYRDGRRAPPPTLQGCVIRFSGQFMERDEDEDGFMDEARMWVKMLKKDGKTKICNTWPDIAALYWGAEDPVVAGPYAEYIKRCANKKSSYR